MTDWRSGTGIGSHVGEGLLFRLGPTHKVHWAEPKQKCTARGLPRGGHGYHSGWAQGKIFTPSWQVAPPGWEACRADQVVPPIEYLPECDRSGESSLWVCRLLISPCILTRQREEKGSKLSGDTYKGTSLIHEGSTLLTSSALKYLPMAPSPNTILLGSRVSTWILEGHKHSSHITKYRNIGG